MGLPRRWFVDQIGLHHRDSVRDRVGEREPQRVLFDASYVGIVPQRRKGRFRQPGGYHAKLRELVSDVTACRSHGGSGTRPNLVELHDVAAALLAGRWLRRPLCFWSGVPSSQDNDQKRSRQCSLVNACHSSPPRLRLFPATSYNAVFPEQQGTYLPDCAAE